MAQVVAVTRIRHGEEDGSVREIAVGEEITGLDDEIVRGLVEAGAAVEIGGNRKFSAPPAVVAEDAETLKRDELLLKSQRAEEEEAGKQAEQANRGEGSGDRTAEQRQAGKTQQK